MLLAGLAVGIIIACFAEVSSRFAGAGGPYLYTRVAFGRAVGVQTAWMLWLAQIAAQAANVNVLMAYLGEFWPDATSSLTRFLLISLLIGVLACINFYGIKAGTRVNNILTIAKILPLLAVVGIGVILLLGRSHAAIPSPAIPARAWFKAVLILFYGIGGFESALAPMSEAKDPRRDAPIALIVGVVSMHRRHTHSSSGLWSPSCQIQLIALARSPKSLASSPVPPARSWFPLPPSRRSTE